MLVVVTFIALELLFLLYPQEFQTIEWKKK